MSEGFDSASAIVKCSHCKRVLSFEDFEKHKCKLHLGSQKTIPVVYFMDTSCDDNELMTGWGIDGTLYTFEVVPRKPIPIIIPLNRRKVTDFKTDEDVTEPRSGFCKVFGESVSM